MDAKTVIDRLGKVPEVAAFFDCTEVAVYRWLRVNRIPKHRLKFLRLARPDVLQERTSAPEKTS